MSLPRRCLERISRNLVFRRRMPVRFGHRNLWVTPGAALVYYRSLDNHRWNDLYDFADQCVQPGDCVWDIGANLGVFAFAAAHRAGPAGEVLAIEADSWLAELTRRSADEIMPATAPVAVLCSAVATEFDLLLFARPERTRSGSHLTTTAGAGDELVGRTISAHPVVTINLDWLAQRRRPPQVLKIDVEGAELAVLKGALNLLKIHRPRLLLEVYDPSADSITQLLHEHGYDLFDYGPDRGSRRPTDRATYHTLALPRPS